MRIPLPIGTFEYENPSASSRRVVNATADQAPGDGKAPVILRRMPGIDSFATAGTACRGGHVMNGILYVVSGTSLFRVESDGTSTNIGSLPGSNRVVMADSGSRLVIVTNPLAYVSDGAEVEQITDPVFSDWGASSVGFIDGYFVFTRPDSEQFFNSGLNDLTFDALDFSSADGATDDLVGLIIDHREIVLAGKTSMEIWFNAGNAVGSPFSRSVNGFIEVGCAARDTLAKIDNTVFWLANDKTVRRLVGTNPTVISNPGISEFIDSQDVSDARATAYTYKDKFYYALTLGGATLEYDIRGQEWHNRESSGETNWKPVKTLDAYDSVVALDSLSGDVGKIDSTVYTEWSSDQIVSWTYQPIYQEGRRVFHDRLEVNIDGGVGVTGGGEPELMLFISDDGGNTFTEHSRAGFGAIGDRQGRAVWHGLGSSYNRVYKCQLSDSVAVSVTDTNADIRVGGF